MKTGVKVLDAMTANPVFVDENMSVDACAKIMSKEKIGSVLIKSEGKLKGIVTEKDFLEKIIAKKLNTNSLKVKDIMTKKIISIAPDEDIYDAIIKMKDDDVRRLPVIHNGKLIGLLTLKDILRIEPQLLDYIVEKFNVRNKPPIRKLNQGKCERCGHLARLSDVDGMMICRMCR